MNITLAAPPNVIQNVRCWADEFYSFAMANSIEMEPGYKYSRVDAAERSMECDK